MEGNLLRKESEFYKLNEQLELKAQKLMEEVEYVMKNPDLPKTFSETTVFKGRVVKGGTLFEDECVFKTQSELLCKEKPRHATKTADKTKHDKPCLKTTYTTKHDKQCSKSTDNIKHDKQYSGSTDNIKHDEQYSGSTDNIKHDEQYSRSTGNSATTVKQIAETIAKLESLPDAAKGVGPEAALHILKVKCQLLGQELETVQIEMKNKTERWKKSRQRFDQLEEDHEKWHHQAQNLEQLYQKQQDRLHRINSNILQTDTENNAMLKEVERLRKDLKQSCQSGTSNKAKVNRCLDENAKLKSALSKMETEEKELKELDLKEKEHSLAKLAMLEKRKIDLVRGVSTQLELTANLKTQLVHMDVLQNIEVVEERLSNL